ncbi:MAG: DNA topoisomerase VI subunit B, partial [Desulfurococcaceae archaeon]|nr:DNA topoisomerase VI subunit B [Desulfurococcaceae archaeon]
VHVCSTKVPFKGVGKESIADIPELRREVKLGIMEAARGLKQYLSKKIREEEAKKRAENIAKYIPEVARSLSIILADEDSFNAFRSEVIRKLTTVVAKKTGVSLDLIQGIVKSVEAEAGV